MRRRHLLGSLLLGPVLTASVLATVVGVQLGWLPALGWYGPRWTVLPALALGLPAGAVLGRLLDDLLPGAFAEPWAPAAEARGLPGPNHRRQGGPPLRPRAAAQPGPVRLGLTAGSVAVEQIYDIPGLGRTTLQAALAQDLPVRRASSYGRDWPRTTLAGPGVGEGRMTS